jgi:hypothetical protein
MGQDKKQLNKLLDFVSELYKDPDNKEFTAGIRSLVMNDRDFLRSGSPDGLPDISDSLGNPLRRIEKYLSLDYDIDFREFPDYSFVTDGSVRERLEADFREMMRYRFGTRSHRIDFPEFCRFATLQFELLTNYYYEMKYHSDVMKVLDAIVTANPDYIPGEHIKMISEIPLKTKVYQFRQEFGWEFADLTPVLQCIEVRNKQSHRSLKHDKDIIAEYEKRLKEGKAWNYWYGQPNYKKVSKLGILTKDELKDYTFQVWFDNSPFEVVITSIGKLISSISSQL